MITVYETHSSHCNNATHGRHCTNYDMYGLSSDTKPNDVGNASTFYEMDTKKLFMFDAQNMIWLEQ